MKGNGCEKCRIEAMANYQTSNAKDFIIKAKKIHGVKYDYSKVSYLNNHTKVEIICPEHGSFFQTTNDHLDGHGCAKCGIDESRTSQGIL